MKLISNIAGILLGLVFNVVALNFRRPRCSWAQ